MLKGKDYLQALYQKAKDNQSVLLVSVLALYKLPSALSECIAKLIFTKPCTIQNCV